MKESEGSQSPIVIKVGGSLHDLPDLGPRLCRWLAGLKTDAVLLVPGGGKSADVVRELDAAHGLGEERSHWFALKTLTIAADFLAALVPGAEIISHPDRWGRIKRAILDPYAFARADEGRAGALPHRWSVSSDSIAARVARVAKAQRLILLKSVTIPPGTDWREAARRGWVDAYFPEAVGDLEVQAVNLREL